LKRLSFDEAFKNLSDLSIRPVFHQLDEAFTAPFSLV